ncbi:MAG: DUF4347 domain-containing protein [Gemmatimonadota bacterium]|nr:DUF4347 domain-containing protein [Gemmatimonadota bacterium]
MITLQLGDKSPMVAVVQMLLNRSAGASPITVDGEFGRETESAVRQFHLRAGHPPLPRLIVEDWAGLIRGTRVAAISCVDTYDPHERQAIPSYLQGSGLVETSGMSNGVAQIVSSIRARVPGPGTLTLLRFHGHGQRGLMAVSAGSGTLRDYLGRSICHVGGATGAIAERASNSEPARCVIDSATSSHTFELERGLHGRQSHLADRTTISLETVRLVRASLEQLRPLFAKMGSVELHGCHVGAGATGMRLLQQLAEIFGVPVSAGVGGQIFGSLSAPRFEGPVRTAFPRHGNLHTWCGHLRGVALP